MRNVDDNRLRILTSVHFFGDENRYMYSAEHMNLLAWLTENIETKDIRKWDTTRSPNSNYVEVVLKPEAQAAAPLLILAWGGKIV